MSIIWQGIPTLGFFLIFISFLVCYKYFQNLEMERNIIQWTLPLIRFFCFLTLSVLIAQPYLIWNQNKLMKSQIDIYIDNSKSMANHYDDLEYIKDTIKSLLDSINNKDLSVQLLSFSNNIKFINNINELEFNGNSSNFTPLVEKINYNRNNFNIIITDGIETEGIELNTFSKKIKKSINIIGVGSINEVQDLSIENVQYPNYIIKGDSLSCLMTISSNVQNNINPVMLINNSNGIIYRKTLEVKSGFTKKDIKFSIPWDQLDKINYIEIKSSINELNLNNNIKKLDVELLENARKITMLSGNLSQNTPFIKKTIKSIPRIKLTHLFKNGEYFNEQWKLVLDQKNSLVILDDYPAKISDLEDFRNIISFLNKNNIPFIYFSGTNNNNNVKNEIATLFNINYKPILQPELKNFINTSTNIYKMIDFSQLPPVYCTGNWLDKSNSDKALMFEDQTIAIAEFGLGAGVFIEEINNLNYKASNLNNPIDFYNYFSDFISNKIKLNENLISININYDHIYYGQEIKIAYQLNPNYFKKNDKHKIQIENDNGEINYINISEINLPVTSVPYLVNTHGKLNLKGFILDEFGDTAWSEPIEIDIEKLHIEDRQQNQNMQGLKSLSTKSGGQYYYIDSISDIVEKLPFKPIQKYVKHSAGIYHAQQYWVILIFMLIIEWIIRKKVGLL